MDRLAEGRCGRDRQGSAASPLLCITPSSNIACANADNTDTAIQSLHSKHHPDRCVLAATLAFSVV